MNSLESDLRRALLSGRFLLAVLAELLVLWLQGPDSTLHKMCVPVLCALPYAGAWLDEYKSGFVKLALVRGSRRGYILGKYLACGLSGGGAEALGAWLWSLLKSWQAGGEGQDPACDIGLLFLSGVVWSCVPAVLAALSNSKYLAYGGGFVLYYFLVILAERYWPGLYCLYPYEWLAPKHVWVMGSRGLVWMLLLVVLVLGMCYWLILERSLENG